VTAHRSEIVAGRLPVLACLKARRRHAECVYVYTGARDVDGVLAYAGETPVQRVEQKQMDALSGGVKHQGVVLRAAPLPVFSIEDWFSRHKEAQAALVVLDGVEDPRNFGAIVRSAAACGAAGVLFAKDRASPVSVAATKAAAGGMEYIDLIQATNLARALEKLKKQGFWIAALDASAAKTIWEADFTGRIAFVIGNEGTGIRRLVKEHSDYTVSIPLAGPISSLNASVSAGVVLAEWVRQTRPR